MKEAFLFLIMARTLQFFIGNQGSRRYVKGFIGIITIVIVIQSVIGKQWSELSFPMPPELQDAGLLNNLSDLQKSFELEPKEDQEEEKLESVYIPDIIIPEIQKEGEPLYERK